MNHNYFNHHRIWVPSRLVFQDRSEINSEGSNDPQIEEARQHLAGIKSLLEKAAGKKGVSKLKTQFATLQQTFPEFCGESITSRDIAENKKNDASSFSEFISSLENVSELAAKIELEEKKPLLYKISGQVQKLLNLSIDPQTILKVLFPNQELNEDVIKAIGTASDSEEMDRFILDLLSPKSNSELEQDLATLNQTEITNISEEVKLQLQKQTANFDQIKKVAQAEKEKEKEKELKTLTFKVVRSHFVQYLPLIDAGRGLTASIHVLKDFVFDLAIQELAAPSFSLVQVDKDQFSDTVKKIIQKGFFNLSPHQKLAISPNSNLTNKTKHVAGEAVEGVYLGWITEEIRKQKLEQKQSSTGISKKTA